MSAPLTAVAEHIFSAIFAISDRIRYVALGEGQEVILRERDDLQNASSMTSDRFEELFVNPALLTLARQRGDLDCGGLRYLIVGYGNFRQLIVPFRAGHLSAAFEADLDPVACLSRIEDLLASWR